ncbi:MAG: histidine kinase dimerization/phospho-acceptor domain-containing protein [Candidatus Dormibacteria bacterium]
MLGGSDSLGEPDDADAEAGGALSGGRRRVLQERERLFSQAAHEFRTPLAIIQCNAELIAEGMVEGADARQAARVIMETVHDTDRTLSELLESSRLRLDAGPIGGDAEVS